MTHYGDLGDVARFLAGYAKQFGAGYRATPLADELSPAHVIEWRHQDERTVAVWEETTRPRWRRDFTGQRIGIPAGTRLVTHLARTLGAPVPNLGAFDLVMAYREDQVLSAGLMHQAREVAAVSISAAAEIVAWWGRPGMGHEYGQAERTALAHLPFERPAGLAEAVLAEVSELHGWRDDHAYYHRGEWSALALRGFRPDDPGFDIKPSEQQRSWKAEHPDAAGYVCGWTTLADECPALEELTHWASDGAAMERVRLLRLTTGQLRRHTDITDRAAGVRNGQVARLHLPLVTDPAITMTVWDLAGRRLETHLAPFHLHYLDARKPHAVANPTEVERVHLVIDVIADEAFRERLAHRYVTDVALSPGGPL